MHYPHPQRQESSRSESDCKSVPVIQYSTAASPSQESQVLTQCARKVNEHLAGLSPDVESPRSSQRQTQQRHHQQTRHHLSDEIVVNMHSPQLDKYDDNSPSEELDTNSHKSTAGEIESCTTTDSAVATSGRQSERRETECLIPYECQTGAGTSRTQWTGDSDTMDPDFNSRQTDLMDLERDWIMSENMGVGQRSNHIAQEVVQAISRSIFVPTKQWREEASVLHLLLTNLASRITRG